MKNRVAVIFDMDGVILNSEPIYREAWRKAAAELGFAVSEDLYARVVGRNDRDSEAIVASVFGDQFPLDDFRGRWRGHWNSHLRDHGIPVKTGVAEILDFLDERGIRKAIATSTIRRSALQCLGDLSRRFDAIVAGDEVKRGKPAPDIYLLAAERLDTGPKHCWVIEDAEAGVEAAHAAGMKPIIVPDLRQPSAEICALAECVCESMSEVHEVLARKL
jgi:beta-phosphoglucomutase-like phosphatase (HAD superfamily)